MSAHHINEKTVRSTGKLFKLDKIFENMPVGKKFFCESCLFGKQTRKSHRTVMRKSNYKPGEKIHTDLCGPVNIESPKGTKYFLLFENEATSYRKVYFLRHKSEPFEFFKAFKALVLRQTGNNIKVLKSDNGKEYVSKEF